MNKLVLIAGLFLLLLLTACEEGTTTETVDKEIASAFYPGGIGSTFQYQVDTLDTSTNSYLAFSSRFSELTGSRAINNLDYNIQLNTAEGSDPVELLFRTTDNAIYFYFDTTGLFINLEAIDDSLASLIEIAPDDEVIAFSVPLIDDKAWDAYRFNVAIPTIAFNLSIVEVRATIEGFETVDLPVLSGTRDAIKLKYDVTTRIPDNPASPFETTERKFTGYSWYVENIGLIRTQGNGLLLAALSGGSIDLADTITVYRETLTNYDIK